MKLRRPVLLLLLFLLLLGAPSACGGDESSVAAGAAQPERASAPASEPAGDATTSMLALDQVATIDGELVLTWSDLDRYLGTVYARLPEGEDALTQLVTESVIDAAAAAAGVSATDDEIAALEARLEGKAREASGGKLGLQESLGQGVTLQDLRAALRLQALHERIVRQEDGLPPDATVEPDRLKAWLERHLPGAQVEQPELDDPVAARWPEGELTKAQVGQRLRSMLAPQDVSGVLTEMLGVLLVRREALKQELALTPAEATREVLERNALLQAKAGLDTVTYDQFVETVQKRSLKEVLASDQFGAEVLLRLITERAWTEDSARAEWEAHPERYPPPATATAPQDWDQMRAIVWKALRQDSYARLFQQSRIVRRF